MTNRREFTKKIAELIIQMCKEKEQPILDYALRSAEEQNRLFKAGKSKCDGYQKISAHQRGKAMDIYFYNEKQGILDFTTKEKYKRWHKKWEEKGGKPMIEWDVGHFEG